MIANIPFMTHIERTKRAEAKAQTVCEFLASGEIYSTPEIIAQLLGLDRSRAVACLKTLEKQGFLRSEQHYFEGRHQRIYGVTPQGLALADACDHPYFEGGKTNQGWIPHRLACQRTRLKAAAEGWTGWTPERILRLDKSLKKIPDAVATNPQGQMVALEVERNVKTQKRYADLLVIYLKSIKAGKFSEVHYIAPAGIEKLLERTITNIKSVKVGSEVVQITAEHLSKFKFFNFETWTKKEEKKEVSNG
jgi:DNA-binding MarR family transcriptional regulator